MAPASKPKGGSRVKKEGKGDLYRICGVDIPYDPELELDKPKPTPLFPEYKVPASKPLTASEKDQVARFRSLRESIHNGPLYAILGDNVRVGKPGNKAAASFNPFEGMSKYSQRYTKKRRTTPKLDTRPYVLKFFPKELWSILDPTATETNGVIGSGSKGKSLRIPGYEKMDDIDLEISGDEGEEKAKRNPEEDEPLEGEEVDDEFDDVDDGGDYNAEQYFDDGGDDAGDDYDGGGDDGGGGEYF
ncbi:hypothetical protein N7G274_003240 [Stereocaulon virgatum]|uniref:DNA-directed RNA polymerase III subunit n=1 Tax=Stereocaulon virgatum TaxID=373712 RepID=A0ABR4AE29_9LECA